MSDLTEKKARVYWKRRCGGSGEVTERKNISQFCFISLSHLITFPRERTEQPKEKYTLIQVVVVAAAASYQQ